MSDFTRPVEKLGKDAAEYVDLKVADLKLKTAKGLSLTLSKLLYLLVVLFFVSMVLFSLAIGGVMWIGEMVGSYAGGAMIVSGVFLLALLVILSLRKRLFRDTFVSLFTKLFFEED